MDRTREVLGCGMVIVFLDYLTMEPWAGSSAFLSPIDLLALLLVDMGGGVGMEGVGDNLIIQRIGHETENSQREMAMWMGEQVEYFG